MEHMVWIAGGGLLGIALGFLGYHHSKAASRLFGVCLLIIGVVTHFYIKFTGGFHGLAAQSGENFFSTAIRKFGLVFELMGLLPMHVQISILVFVGAFFVARIIAWFAAINKPEKVESLEARKKRILKSYGMKSMEELRRRY